MLHRLLLRLPPETAHDLAIRGLETLGGLPALRQAVLERYAFSNPLLETSCFGLRFANPIGIAAGFDKDGRTVPTLESLGFGFVEVGTVTPEPQPGNEAPRLARLPAEEALVNRLGFPSRGAAAVRANLTRHPRTLPLGINLGKNKATPLDRAVDDYLRALRILYERGDYFVVNISSPNTPGLRDLHRSDLLDALLGTLQAAMRDQASRHQGVAKPLLLKVSPDLPPESIETVAESVRRHNVHGVVVANTTVNSPLIARAAVGGGGLSGRPIRALTTALIGEFFQRLRGRAEIIGVGGIFSAENAYEKIAAGASLVQVYTGFVYEGPRLAGRICRRLADLLTRDGWPNVQAAVGSRAGTVA